MAKALKNKLSSRVFWLRVVPFLISLICGAIIGILNSHLILSNALFLIVVGIAIMIIFASAIIFNLKANSLAESN